MTQEDQAASKAPDNERAEIERLQGELGREHDLYLRALADFENYRKRVERDRAGAAEQGKRDLLLSLLDLADDFDRALAHADESPDAIVAGLHAMRRRLAHLLNKYGVVPFESVGQSFDPALHEAIGTVNSDQHGTGSVYDEVSRGYRWGDEILRPARVRVVQ